jgi:hypothetical protein
MINVTNLDFVEIFVEAGADPNVKDPGCVPSGLLPVRPNFC